jgi:hypothetical protein
MRLVFSIARVFIHQNNNIYSSTLTIKTIIFSEDQESAVMKSPKNNSSDEDDQPLTGKKQQRTIGSSESSDGSERNETVNKFSCTIETYEIFANKRLGATKEWSSYIWR